MRSAPGVKFPHFAIIRTGRNPRSQRDFTSCALKFAWHPGIDELPPQTRTLLEKIKSLVREKMAEQKLEQRYSLFSRRELRDFTSWSQMQIRRHLERLLELEYLNVRGGRNGVAMKYELLTEIEEGDQAYHVGLLDVAKLRAKNKAKSTPTKETLSV